MQCSFGITGKDFVLLASDTSASRSIIQFKSDENKIKALGPHLAMAYGGEPGDTNNFAEYVERNLRLYTIRHDQPLLPPSASSWIRRTLANSIRSRRPYAVKLLLAGFDVTTMRPHLYWLDELGTRAEVPYAAHGMGMHVALSTMDKWCTPGINKVEGLEVLRKCIDEAQTRLTVKFAFNAILIDVNGIHTVDLAAADPLAPVHAAQAAADAKAAQASSVQAEAVASAEAVAAA
ncbi:Proteasome subunit beta type-4 [Cryptotrichosporon argae]